MTRLDGPLIGRERELALVEQLLAETRLVTVTGIGGCGKTRLVRELAARTEHRHEREVVFVALADLDSNGSVAEAARRALGLRERPGASAQDLVVERLREGGTLLVLDNCEHLVESAARLAESLLEATAGRIVATSRVPLGLAAEGRLVLSPLSLPQDDGVLGVLRSDAARMFLDVASVARPGLELDRTTAGSVAQICKTLDGLPLALALAGARAAEMAVHEIAAGLAERGALSEQTSDLEPPQHRSLRASLEWSFGLLEQPDRDLIGRLSAFTGGWSLAAARAVCAPQDTEADVHTGLLRLEAAGLIVPQPAVATRRWAFLSTVGEFAREQLPAAGERAALRRRHREWARRLAERSDELLLTPAGREALDHDGANIASALENAIVADADADADAAVAIVAGLARHWILAERLAEGRAACAAAMAVAGRVRDTGARATLHCTAALIAVLGEDYANALTQLDVGLALAAGGDPAAEARCMESASMVEILTGDFERGLVNAHRAAESMRAFSDQVGLALALATIAQAEGLCERFDGVRRAYEEFLQTAASDHPRLRAWAEVAIAWAELITGSPRIALEHADAALALEGDWPSITHFVGVCHRVHALALLGRADEALAEGSQAMERARSAGIGMAVATISVALAVAHAAAGELDSAETLASSLIEMPQMHTRALMGELLVRVALERGEHEQAGERLLALEELAGRTGSQRLTALCEHLRGRAAAQSGDAAKARTLLQSALARQADAGHVRAAAATLEELAMVMPLESEPGRRPRLAGAALRAMSELGCQPSSASLERVAAARRRFTDRFGEAAWDEAWAEGRAVPLHEAIAYARRARGSRTRAEFGWDALTPTEAEVAMLAAKGLSNPEVATRLFMSRGTVKSHLSMVYAKLGVANRTQLATLAARDAQESSPLR